MYNSGINSSSDFNYNYSSKSSSFIEDISSIASSSYHDPQQSPWAFCANQFFSPLSSESAQYSSVYQENLKLKQRIQELEDTLKQVSSKNTKSPSECTQSTNWFSEKKQSFKTEFEGFGVIKNLQKDFDMISSNGSETGTAQKRFREFDSSKTPSKIIKLAMFKSIGTFKF